MLKMQKGFSLPAFLFGAVFFSVGSGIFLFVLFPDLCDWQEMKTWVPVQANIINVKLDSSHGDKGTTYSVNATYIYTYKGGRYQNNRVTISGGSDNVGDYHQIMYRKLKKLFKDEEPVRVWLDPNNPQNSIVDREMRWGLFAFMGIFVGVFGGVGFVIILVSIFSGKKDKNFKRVLRGDVPIIRSNAISKFVGGWFLAIIWNGVSIPVTYFAYQEYLDKNEPLLLLVFIFPALGFFILLNAISSTLEFIRFGRLELLPDPFPGSIGGNVGGTIKLNENYNPAIKYQLVLSCIYIYYTSGGRNNSRSRHERLIWQREGIARSDSCEKGTKLDFCFDIPEGLPETTNGSDHHEWRLELKADLPGIDLERQFTIPVENGIQTSSSKIQDAKVVLAASEVEIPEKFLQIDDTLAGVKFYYPPLKGGMLYIFKLLIGLGIVGFVSWIGFSAAKSAEEISLFILFFVAVFGLIVALGIGFSLYQLLHTLVVTIEGGMLISSSRIIFPVKTQQIAVHDICKIEKKRSLQISNQGQTPVAYYKVEVFASNGKRICVARGVKGEQLAEAIVERVKGYI